MVKKISKRRKTQPSVSMKECMRIVDATINKVMVEFTNLGYKSKDLQKQVNVVHKKMAALFLTLKPCEERVRALYPQLNELFDSLTSNYHKSEE